MPGHLGVGGGANRRELLERMGNLIGGGAALPAVMAGRVQAIRSAAHLVPPVWHRVSSNPAKANFSN
jgi:hypothetical protein